jgi:hypothetical protein
MSSEIKANKISPATGTAFTFGDSGDTFTIPSGATITNSGTATGFGGNNTPAFSAFLSSDQTGIADATMTTIIFNSEVIDSDSAYDTSNGRFTVPSGEGGKYWVAFNIMLVSTGINVPLALQARVLKNGSTNMGQAEQQTHYISLVQSLYFGTILDLSAGDYIEAQGYVNTSDGSTVSCAGDAHYRSYFTGYKMIGL